MCHLVQYLYEVVQERFRQVVYKEYWKAQKGISSPCLSSLHGCCGRAEPHGSDEGGGGHRRATPLLLCAQVGRQRSLKYTF